MERSQLSLQGIVAVYPTHPVPTDPYAAHLRGNVRQAIVEDLTDGQVLVTYGEPGAEDFTRAGGVEAVTPRQVIAYWHDWEANLATRAERSHEQSDRVQRRIDNEAAALTIAQRDYPSARVADHCIIIPIDDWLAVNGA